MLLQPRKCASRRAPCQIPISPLKFLEMNLSSVDQPVGLSMCQIRLQHRAFRYDRARPGPRGVTPSKTGRKSRRPSPARPSGPTRASAFQKQRCSFSPQPAKIWVPCWGQNARVGAGGWNLHVANDAGQQACEIFWRSFCLVSRTARRAALFWLQKGVDEVSLGDSSGTTGLGLENLSGIK